MKKFCTIILMCLCVSLIAEDSLPEAPLKLKTQEITIGKNKLIVEIADTPQAMQKGLMFREKLDPNKGMVFVFPDEEQASFWMKNTSIPLSIAYIDSQGKILEIYPLEPFNENVVFSNSDKIHYALEVNRGWFEVRGIRPGDIIRGLPKK